MELKILRLNGVLKDSQNQKLSERQDRLLNKESDRRALSLVGIDSKVGARTFMPGNQTRGSCKIQGKSLFG